jgi:hypothetical protein
MPLGFIIYPDLRLLFIRAQGVITQPERVHAMLSWLRDPGYPLCIDALFDISAAESTPRVAELRELINILRQQAPSNGPRRLAVVTSKPIAFGIAKMFAHILQLKGVPLQIEVFLECEIAWAWLRPGMPTFQMDAWPTTFDC